MAKFLFSIVLTLALVVIVSCQTCGPNQHYEAAGPKCPTYCGKPAEVTCEGTKAGCFCDSGYIFDANFENCIPTSQCEPAEACGDHQTYNRCGTRCPKHCDRLEDVICIKICNPGCYCDPGYVFVDEALGICVPIESCTEEEES